MKQLVIHSVLLFIFPTLLLAKNIHPEKWYQKKYCMGSVEVRMPDKTRCDCLTKSHAIEFK